MNKTFPMLLDEEVTRSLRQTLAAEPPQYLRRRVLAAHARRRVLAPALALAGVLAIGAGLFAAVQREQRGDLAAWQARSQSLESAWLDVADRDWLAADARATPLLVRLRSVDRRLGQLHETGEDSKRLAELWKERAETLAELVEVRRQGGRAIRL